MVGGLVIAFAIYLFSLLAHPSRRCWTCGRRVGRPGTGRQHGAVFSYAWRVCRNCHGTGRRWRLGVWLFVPPNLRRDEGQPIISWLLATAIALVAFIEIQQR